MNTQKLVLALLTFLIATVSQAAPVEIIEFKEIEGGENLTLHIAYPKGHTPADKSVAVVFFFGGGWKQGKPGQFYPYIMDLAKHGIVGISAQYRTKSSHDANPAQCVQDGKSAIRYVREHAAELGVDPDKILAGGGSAGGHVALCTAIDVAPDPEGENMEVSSRPAALILFNPVVSVGPDGGYAHGYVKRFVEWETVSPIHQVNASFPPTLVQVGTADKLLPVAMMESFDVKMEEAGVPCETVFYEGAPHGFFNKPEYRQLTIDKMNEFLKSLGYLE